MTIPVSKTSHNEGRPMAQDREEDRALPASTAEFWNGILRDHVNAQTIAERVTKTVAPTGDYRGWSISWDYGEYSATSPNYDASWEGPEDGWVDNGERVFARTLPDLYAEIDAFLAEQSA